MIFLSVNTCFEKALVVSLSQQLTLNSFTLSVECFYVARPVSKFHTVSDDSGGLYLNSKCFHI